MANKWSRRASAAMGLAMSLALAMLPIRAGADAPPQAAPAAPQAQPPAAAEPAGRQGGGRRGGGPGASPRANAAVDLTGTWVSLVTEDWRWRMMTPPKGDYSSIPLNPAGVAVANAWDPAKDTAAGEQCRAYGAAAIMRVPGRVRISWQDDTTLKVDTEAGTQTRLFSFTRAQPGAASWQGSALASWQPAGGRRGGAGGGSLKVVTTNLKPGYLRKNGVPYSSDTVVTEYFNRLLDPVDNATYLVVTTVVEDPQYLQQRWFTSSHFKKVDDGTWKPSAC
jgi:hypothetical protein